MKCDVSARHAKKLNDDVLKSTKVVKAHRQNRIILEEFWNIRRAEESYIPLGHDADLIINWKSAFSNADWARKISCSHIS